MSANEFLKVLRDYRGKIPKQKMQTLRGQALAGDVNGAWRGLQQVIRNNTEHIADMAVD